LGILALCVFPRSEDPLGGRILSMQLGLKKYIILPCHCQKKQGSILSIELGFNAQLLAPRIACIGPK
jgi:hypothetical protein